MLWIWLSSVFFVKTLNFRLETSTCLLREYFSGSCRFQEGGQALNQAIMLFTLSLWPTEHVSYIRRSLVFTSYRRKLLYQEVLRRPDSISYESMARLPPFEAGGEPNPLAQTEEARKLVYPLLDKCLDSSLSSTSRKHYSSW